MEIKSFMIRNSGNDFWYTHFRDAAIQLFFGGKVDVDYQAYQPAIFYLNGEYWGIQNLRERSDEDFVLSNYATEDIDMIENWWGELKAGDKSAWDQLMSELRKSSSQQNIQWIINEFGAELLTVPISPCSNTDFPGNNMVMWRPRHANGKWRFILKDTDHGMGIWGSNPITHNALRYNTESNDDPRRLFNALLTQESFKKNFVFETDRHYNKMRYELGLVSGESEEYFINPSSKKKQYVDRYAVINRKGQLLTPFKYESTYYPCLGEPGGVIVEEEYWITKDGYRSNEIVCDKCQKKWNYYYLDSLGREAMKVDGDLLYEHFQKSSKDTITVVSRQTENGVVYSFPAFDALQNPQPTLEYNDPPKDVIYRFEESGTYNIVRKASGKIGLDSLGHTIIPAIYEEIQELDDDYYIVKKNDKYALADKRGNFLTPFDYFEIRRFTKDLYRINKGVKSGRYGGLINKQGTLVLFGYRSMEVLEKEQIILASDYDGIYSLVNLHTGKSFVSAEHIVRFSDKAMLVKRNNKWGLVDLVTEQMIIPMVHESLERTSDFYLIGKKDISINAKYDACIGCPPKDYKYGVLDSQGNEIIPFEYEEIVPYYGNLLILKKK